MVRRGQRITVELRRAAHRAAAWPTCAPVSAGTYCPDTPSLQLRREIRVLGSAISGKESAGVNFGRMRV